MIELPIVEPGSARLHGSPAGGTEFRVCRDSDRWVFESRDSGAWELFGMDTILDRIAGEESEVRVCLAATPIGDGCIWLTRVADCDLRGWLAFQEMETGTGALVSPAVLRFLPGEVDVLFVTARDAVAHAVGEAFGLRRQSAAFVR